MMTEMKYKYEDPGTKLAPDSVISTKFDIKSVQSNNLLEVSISLNFKSSSHAPVGDHFNVW